MKICFRLRTIAVGLALLCAGSVYAEATAEAAPRGFARRGRRSFRRSYQRRLMRVLARPVSAGQAGAVWSAHMVGALEVGKDGKRPAQQGNYTFSQLRRKAAILGSAGISREERRVLMKAGIVGKKGKKGKGGGDPRSELTDEVDASDSGSFWSRLFRQQERDGHYSSKGGHKERSRVHQPQHDKHWKKEDRKDD
ncbi:MAG: hypothetical protein KC503_40440 [Myxococcales bacterium]|nr:hypothetical protein [Myxococcales bacterium]